MQEQLARAQEALTVAQSKVVGIRQRMSGKNPQSSNGGEVLYCSFCGKTQREVQKLIAGPGVYVCDECVELCNEILRDELKQAPA